MSLVCPDSQELLGRMGARAREERVPLSGGLSLTHRCNLRCVHCYAREGVPPPRPELTCDQIKGIIDQVAAEGCLFMLLTGGEPLLRPDFPEIYRYVREQGIFVSLFTNATLLTEDHVALLKELPPHHVDVSLYGASADTYERITGQAAAYDRCMDGIRRLLDVGVDVKIKTVLMSLNKHEFERIRAMARELTGSFRFDPAIFPRFEGDTSPTRLRVPPEEAVALEFSDPERLPLWREYHERTRDTPIPQRLYACGAGVSSFHIDPYGFLQSCLMSTEVRYDLLQGSFTEGWRDAVPSIWDKPMPDDYACADCSSRALCGACPPFSKLELQDETGTVGYLCELANRRRDCIMQGINE